MNTTISWILKQVKSSWSPTTMTTRNHLSVSRPWTKRSPAAICRFHVPNRADGYADMQEFIDTVGDKPLQQLLEVAIHGKGAFRSFKDVLACDPAEQQRWLAFQMERLDTRVREWLADEGVRAEPKRPES